MNEAANQGGLGVSVRGAVPSDAGLPCTTRN